MDSKALGALVGLAFGLVLVAIGPAQALAVVFFVVVGWLVGKIVAREIDLVALLEWLSRRRPK